MYYYYYYPIMNFESPIAGLSYSGNPIFLWLFIARTYNVLIYHIDNNRVVNLISNLFEWTYFHLNF
jgi:hypothetical protein